VKGSNEPIGWRDGNELINEIGSDANVGERIQFERKARGWSQAELARQLKKIGHPIHQSAISKIEPEDRDQTAGRRRGSSPERRRSVTISELIGFSKVFGVPFGELLLPPDRVIGLSAWHDFLVAAEQRNEIRNRQAQYLNSLTPLRRDARRSQDFVAKLSTLRREVMEKITEERRQTFESDNDKRQVRGERRKRWNPAMAEEYRPPVVQVIDDVLTDDLDSLSVPW
jgi:transcriptional regulator with XRE-family HTH domain